MLQFSRPVHVDPTWPTKVHGVTASVLKTRQDEYESEWLVDYLLWNCIVSGY